MAANQIDTVYVVERVVFIALFGISFVLFATQNYVRVCLTTPKQGLVSRRNAKCVNHLAGLSASFWAIVCWTDVHHVFMPSVAELNEFAFAAAFCSLIAGYVVHVSIAVRALSVNGFFKRSASGGSAGGCCGKVDANGVLFWISLVSPWAGAAAMTLAMVFIDRAWPSIIFILTGALVITVTATRLVIIRRRLSEELHRLNPNEQRMYERGMKNMRRWQRFTRMSIVLVAIAVLTAVAFTYVFLTEDRHQRVAFLSRETYEIDGGGFSTVAGVVLLALLSSSLWFSWMWPGEQILSSGHTNTNGSNTNGSVTNSGTADTKSGKHNATSKSSATRLSAAEHYRRTSVYLPQAQAQAGARPSLALSCSRSTGDHLLLSAVSTALNVDGVLPSAVSATNANVVLPSAVSPPNISGVILSVSTPNVDGVPPKSNLSVENSSDLRVESDSNAQAASSTPADPSTHAAPSADLHSITVVHELSNEGDGTSSIGTGSRRHSASSSDVGEIPSKTTANVEMSSRTRTDDVRVESGASESADPFSHRPTSSETTAPDAASGQLSAS